MPSAKNLFTTASSTSFRRSMCCQHKEVTMLSMNADPFMHACSGEQCRQYLHSPATFPGHNQPNRSFMANVSLGKYANITKVRDIMQIMEVNFSPFDASVGGIHVEFRRGPRSEGSFSRRTATSAQEIFDLAVRSSTSWYATHDYQATVHPSMISLM